MSLQAIKYERGSLQLLDQRLLPFEMVYLPVPDAKAAWTQIKDMVVRGAPAIGVTGALAMAVELHTNKAGGKDFATSEEAVAFIISTLDYLVTSRPTAVNLADAAAKLKRTTQEAAAAAGATAVSICETVIARAEAFLEEDISANRAMGAHGSKALLAAAKAAGRAANGRVRVLTHCNTGSLATAGFGTALGVIRALHEQGVLEHAYCTETRPYNQGARLTAFELVHDGLPATLICDSAAAALMAQGKVDAVVVGADRVVANGDTANKIGTYMLAIVAKHHNIPFFVAAPTTTIDANLPSGDHIEIEQRPPEEITHFRGTRVAAANVGIWNPCFDATPGTLIEGIITEEGMVPKKAGAYQVREFMQQLGMWEPADANGHKAAADGALPPGFSALDCDKVKHYIVKHPQLLQLVGPADSAASWAVKEVGDGNINFVYVIEGPAGSLVVKQALPFVRCVGESWPLTQERVRIEAEALQDEASHCPAHVPRVHLYDGPMSVIAMQYLAPPFIILRRGLIAGKTYPHLAEHVAEFLASTLFNTSLIKLTSTTYRERMIQYTNNEMCRLTEQVIFTEPYITSSNNRWTTPQLDDEVAALQADVDAKVAASRLKALFCGKPQALLHGDLHTGSIMVTDSETYLIDPEFAFYGPIAFDVAKIIANLLLCYFSTDGHEAASGQSRKEQQEWLLQTVCSIWNQFSAKFLQLWNAHGAAGDLYPSPMVGGAPANGPVLPACQQAYMAQLFEEVLMFAGSFMIRRIVGIAHVADLDSIADADVRAACERRALRFGRTLLVRGPQLYTGIEAVTQAAAAARS